MSLMPRLIFALSVWTLNLIGRSLHCQAARPFTYRQPPGWASGVNGEGGGCYKYSAIFYSLGAVLQDTFMYPLTGTMWPGCVCGVVIDLSGVLR